MIQALTTKFEDDIKDIEIELIELDQFQGQYDHRCEIDFIYSCTCGSSETSIETNKNEFNEKVTQTLNEPFDSLTIDTSRIKVDQTPTTTAATTTTSCFLHESWRDNMDRYMDKYCPKNMSTEDLPEYGKSTKCDCIKDGKVRTESKFPY